MTSRNRKKGIAKRRAALLFVILTLAVVAFLTFSYLRGRDGERLGVGARRSGKGRSTQAGPERLEERLKVVASELGARAEDVKVTPSWRQSPERWTILVPANQSLLKCNLAVTEEVKVAGGTVADAFEGSSRQQGRFLRMQIAFGDKNTHTVTFRKSREVAPVLRASLVIVIDDLGYGGDALLDEFLSLDYPITFSVLPGYRGSRKAQDAVIARGKEVLLHLPMEPHGYPGIDPGKHPILVDLSEAEIRERVGRHLGNLPRACGISNHMGSLAVQDPEVMRSVLRVVKERGLFFLDSKTSPTTACKKVAAELGVVCLENDLFLDTVKKDEKSVRKLFEKAEKIALARGRAVAIGHLYPNTLKVLKSRLPLLEEKGIKLVPISDFAQSSADVL